MDEHNWLAKRFEADRTHLKAVAYRMLGSLSEADDAVQEAWLRLSRSDTSGVPNVSRADGLDPEHEALLADSVGLALLVVLETLTPAERLAFVLHDMFSVPFEEIVPIVGRSPTAARQLASRARRRVRGATTSADAGLACQREAVDAFLAASREGDFEALLAVLDPDVVVRIDGGAVRAGLSREVRSVRAVAEQTLTFSRLSPFVRPALVNGAAGVVVAPRGRPFAVMGFTVRQGKIVEIDVLADPARLRQLDLAVPDHRR